MKKSKILTLLLFLTAVSSLIAAATIPPENSYQVRFETTHYKTTRDFLDNSQVLETTIRALCWFEPAEDGKILEATHHLNYDLLVDGEQTTNPALEPYVDLTLYALLDEDLFVVDILGLEELDRRIMSIRDPFERQAVLSATSGEVVRQHATNKSNEERAIIIFAVENLGDAFEWDYEHYMNGTAVPFTAQVMAERGTFEDQEVYIIHLVRLYTGGAESSYAKAMVASLGLSLPRGIRYTNVEQSAFETLYVGLDDLFPIAVDRYEQTIIEFVAAGETVEFRETEEFTYRSVPYFPEEPEASSEEIR